MSDEAQLARRREAYAKLKESSELYASERERRRRYDKRRREDPKYAQKRKEWRQKNKEEQSKVRKEYLAKNRAKINAGQREFYAKNRARLIHEKWVVALQKKYGITEQIYLQMLDKQGGVCACCGVPPQGGTGKDRMLHVDHDHATGDVRWLLCGNCNHMLGHARESPEILRRGADLLEGRQKATTI